MPESIQFYNRYTHEIETEIVYGERWLRWAYESPWGRAAMAVLIKRAIFSKWYGWRMSRPESRGRVLPFIEAYHINRDEMLGQPEFFPTFNAFFARKLKRDARPIAAGKDVIVFPADGRHFAIPNLSENDGIFVKGVRFDLAALLRDDALTKKFARGSMLISRLCPVDYHRFHFPFGGIPSAARTINGPLYSVSPIALRQRPTLLWENKRCLTRLDTEAAGEVLLVEVGATCVGSICQTYHPGRAVAKGDEKGYFLFGGSCLLTIFEPGRVRFARDLLEQSAERREVYARMGDEMAVATSGDKGSA
jgi:phosphatidylserine decarboxylase